jgi:hypothetical protein
VIDSGKIRDADGQRDQTINNCTSHRIPPSDFANVKKIKTWPYPALAGALNSSEPIKKP